MASRPDASRGHAPHAHGSAQGPLYLFSLLFTGTIGGWCLPFIFVRLFTADGVTSLKKSAALAMPLSLFFGIALLLFGMFASRLAIGKRGDAQQLPEPLKARETQSLRRPLAESVFHGAYPVAV